MNAVTQLVWHFLCQRTDLVANSGVVARWKGAQVALIYLPEQAPQLFAVSNIDPRSQAGVVGRGIVGHLQGELVIAAPLYKQHFRLRDGVCVEDPALRLTVWPVRLCGESVEIAEIG